MQGQMTIERLNEYTETVTELDFLLKKKEFLKERIAALKSPDYTKSKVTCGKKQDISEQERYVITLEKINKKINDYKYKVLPEHEAIKTAISKIKKWQYRKVLVYRYLEKWKWSQIIAEFFEFEDDFDEEKNFKYKEKIMYWHRKALKELIK